MGIPADLVKALVDDLEIMAIPRHEDKDEGIDIQQMVITALASLDIYTPRSSTSEEGFMIFNSGFIYYI